MKRSLFVIITLLFVAILCGCTNETEKQNQTKMYIDITKLTDEEKNIADLLGADTKQHIFDFYLDDTVQSMYINTYELVDGEWKLMNSNSSRAFSDDKGRLAIDFEKGLEDLRIAVQSEHSSGSFSNNSDIENDNYDGMGETTSVLSNQTEIVYEKEIPLAIQIVTSKNEISSYMVEYFEHPEEYEKHDYEHVYAITVMFSQKPLS